MANRPVFMPSMKAPFVDTISPEFNWNGGFAVSQKQKNITALHQAFNMRYPELKVLEISSKSMQDIGVKLSAFNLKKYVPALGKSIPLECIFQGGKVFEHGGPYTDLYEATPRDAKRDERLRTSGPLDSFFFDGKNFPLYPSTTFYNWLYICALLENPDLAEKILEFDAFTDIEFNPNKSVNCQARAAALFIAMHRKGVVEECRDFDKFFHLLKGLHY